MIKLDEITRAIIKHEREEFGTGFSLSGIKSLDNMVNRDWRSDGRTYLDISNTKFTYVFIPKASLDYIWNGELEDYADEFLRHKNTPEFIRNYFNYDLFIDDCKEDGRPHHFNGYDGSTEIETENWYIYYHNMNYR